MMTAVNRIWIWTLLFATISLASAASAQSGAASLQRFFDSVSAYTASFEQALLDDNRQVIERSAGIMWIARPGQFRWNYAPPVEQQIVSDGVRVWIYDVDLEQVTVRLIDDALGRTPAILLAGNQHLDDRFLINTLATVGETQWLELKPKETDTQFESVKIGFEQGVLRSLEFLDALGQITQIRLNDVTENPVLEQGLFSFSPPAGTDVVDETSQ